ncbi:MAG: hydantoinase/oxoprolinase family protein [Candidatus Eremiobacteraeota bacterium]|nr:hydantoinase/oxoprolinase family protein [Candidatus Eremiobacteraeota bacterium]
MKENLSENNKNRHSFIGIDIGGTFTDAVIFTDGELKVMKTSTRPHNPASGVLELVRMLETESFILTHGSTLATNAVLERKGERTAFLTTAGFKDMLSIGRQDRKELYNLDQEIPQPLIPRDLCYGINERIDHVGDILTPINTGQVREILVDLMEKKVRSLSVCLLFSYINPDHERDIKVVSEGLPLFVSLSSDVLPQYREFERASTTTLNAYVSPILNRYITSLGSQLREMGCVGFKIMESNGGILPAESASSLGVRTILSGPAGGVAGAFRVAENAGYSNIITLDMGGTSTDVSLCEGEIGETYEGDIDGFPIALPMVDIVTIGAGGGSIARVDPGGILKVGPESAGADPGPAAYGKGDLPTVTDAHLVLGTISPCDFLGGGFHVERDRAVEAVSKIAEKLDITTRQSAVGIVRIAISHMERALRVVSLERGRDPALFTLVPFGGAGPLHAPFMAEELGIKRILIPRYPGVLSAMGMLMCDFVMDFSKSVLQPADRINDVKYREITEELYERAKDYLNTGNFNRVIFEHDYDMRYGGQSFEIPIPGVSIECPMEFKEFSLPDLPAFNSGDIVEKFHKQHKRRYGFQREEEPVEIVNFRIKMTGIIDKPALKEKPLCDESPDEAFVEEREITTLDGEKIIVPTYSRDKLKPGNKIKSPAIVVQYDTTILIPKPWNGRVDGFENIILE